MRFLLAIALILLSSPCLLAGPPFVTDDPEPVDFNHWEVYIASITSHDPSGRNGTLPHIEVNRGIAPNLQLHIFAPYAFNQIPGQPISRGYGVTELGIKYRFVQETKTRPMVGIFPLIEVPTGLSPQGFSSTQYQFFLPVWVQKSYKSWTTYGGGGYYINPGQGNRSFWLFGWLIQKDLSKQWTLGGEIFETTSSALDTPTQLNINIGGFYNIDEGHHILFSSGHGIRGGVEFLSYLGFQWTFGPHEPEQTVTTDPKTN